MDIPIINKWLQIAQSWLLPPICLLCGVRGEDSGLCAACRAELPWQSNACIACALPLARGELCGQCLQRRPSRDESFAVFDYAPPIDALIQRVKFNGDLACARLLGHLMVEGIQRRQPSLPRALIPVPLHRGRLASRGYNQALELARPIARALHLPIEYACVTRIRATAEQSGLGAAARGDNLRDAFVVRHRDGNRIGDDVAIIDDVMTTGHTVDALAGVLKRAGVRHVRVWVCARALLQP